MFTEYQKAIISLILSALTFASMTVGVKYLGEASWPTFTVIWGRFVVGLFYVSLFRALQKQGFPRPNNKAFVFTRAMSNFIAVSFFYFSIYFTTLVKANLLNMTYPVFIALFAPIALKEKSNWKTWSAVFLCLMGIFLILGLDVDTWVEGDLYGLICGVLASVSIMSLRGARKYDDSSTILFYVMLFGSVGLFPFVRVPEVLTGEAVLVFAVVSSAGVLGQFFITHSYKYVTAITGALTGTVRILFSAVFGLLFFSERLSLSLMLGATLIVIGVYFIQTANKKADS